MKGDPLVSVLTVTYNHERFIEKSMMSVIKQRTDFDYELLVGEDCSTDGTSGIVKRLAKEHPDRIRAFINKKNLRAFDNFNNILKKARGKYIAILDGDDYWIDTNKLQKQVDYLDEHENCIVCHTKSMVVDEDGIDLGYTFPSRIPKRKSTLEDQLKRNVVSNLTAMFRNGYVQRIPDFAKKHYANDWVLYILLARYGTIDYLDIVTSAYRRNPSGVSVTSGEDGKSRGRIRIYKEIKEYLKGDHSSLIERLIRREKSRLYAVLSYKEARRRKRRNALRLLYVSVFKYGLKGQSIPWKLLALLTIVSPDIEVFLKRINKGFLKSISRSFFHKMR